jgi:peptide/nickel transport system permease protein
LFVVIVLFPSLFATHDPFIISAGEIHAPPSSENWFGTDELGRDVYSRVIYGVRISLGSGLFVVLGALVIGAVVGTYAGYRGGGIDNALMRIADVFLAFPGLVMAMAFVAALGPGLRNAMLALIIIWWPQYARLVRGQVLVLKEFPYVEAARATGARDIRILVRHMLPNFFAPLFVKGTLDVGHAILLTAGLSFLGLGAQPPTPELGAMVTTGRLHILTSWWYSTFPGLAIFIAVLAVNLVGDGLRDLLDPTLRRD